MAPCCGAMGSNVTLAQLRGSVLNLSVSGMLLECETELAVGSDLDFAFVLEPSADSVVGCGRVVRRDANGRFGVEFYGIEAAGPERIRLFVEG